MTAHPLAALLAVACCAAPVAGGEPESVGGKVVAYCKKQWGMTVGKGENTDFVKAALKEAGAKPRGKDSPDKGDYVWGDLVLVVEASPTGPRATQGSIRAVKPGDVIQFRDAKFHGRKLESKGTYTLTMSHFTSVVTATAAEGQLLRVYHQNFGGKKAVSDARVQPIDLKAGWIRVYRPVAK